MRRIFLYNIVLPTAIFLLASDVLLAQQATITGEVRHGNERLQAATVSIGNKILVTDQNGEFHFPIQPGKYVIAITHAGYKKMEQEVAIETDNSTNLDFDMVPNEELERVTTLGSRSIIQRSNLNTPVPIDVFTAAQLAKTGQITLTQMLTVCAPSFNTAREVSNESVTLRGLDPQHVLILVNNIRYHNLAELFGGILKGQLGRGSVGNDLNSIPFSAIDKIEILRDGASAQYGSDAIAGVINIQLKKITGKTSIQLHLGQFYEGDGEKFSLGINRGYTLFKKGFVNFSASYRYQASTFRGGIYKGPVYIPYPKKGTRDDSIRARMKDDSIVAARGFNQRAAIDNAGNTKLTSGGLSMNGGLPINAHIDFYWTVMASLRKMDRPGKYFLPKDSDQQKINYALFPDGFQPRFKPNTVDLSAMAGLKGETKSQWRWDYCGSYGSNSVASRIVNTNNVSQSLIMGKSAPTDFYNGKSIYRQLTNDINVGKIYNLQGEIKTFGIGLGAEWRLENYQTLAGEEASYKNYDSSHYATSGTGGIDSASAIDKNRNVLAAYVELESEISTHLLFNTAMRYEYYSDFGGNIAGKLAARYKLSDKFSLRGSISNGFRAPSLQQRYLKSLGWTFKGPARILVTRGIFPNDHYVTDSFGVPSLTAEKSINLGGGFTATMLKHICVTVDAYWIQIKNRVILSSSLDTGTRGVREILSSIPNIKVDQVQFFTNAINTRTRGIDIILDGNWNLGKARLGASLAANFTSTHLFGDITGSEKLPTDTTDIMHTKGLFNIEDRTIIEKGQPDDKIILSISYQRGKTEANIRNTRFGKTTIAPIQNNKILYETFTPKILTDISLSYLIKQWVKVTAGANNIFDVYPDLLKNYDNTNEGRWIYSPEASPFGFNGGYYFVSMSFNF